MEHILNIQNVSKVYHKHVALNDVSFNVNSGAIFGLLGPNGAGKTSLIRMINQITYPDTGQILFQNQPLQSKHIERIGYLPEERGLYKKMKVAEQILYFAQLKGMALQSAQKQLNIWLDKFDIQNWKHKKIEELSKGMQQKVQFIITLIHQPKIVILDEPFSGFDPINAQLIKNEIAELKKNGSTIIFSTHNMDSVEELCDDIVLINKSQKILEGSVKNIKSNYKKNQFKITFTGNLLGFINALCTNCKLIDKTTQHDEHAIILELNPPYTSNQLLSELLNYGTLISFHEILPSMNEIFLNEVSDNTY